jgi:TRL (tRNA-associated locus)-like protein
VAVRARAAACAALLGLSSGGCITGLIYSHVTVPLDVNLDRTPVREESSRESWNTLRYYLQFDWGSDGIGDVAKRHGFERIDYADLETVSVLGVWSQHWAVVYGQREEPVEQQSESAVSPAR